MAGNLVTVTPALTDFAAHLTGYLLPHHLALQARDMPRGPVVLHVDDSRRAVDPTRGTRYAFWLLDRLSEGLGGYTGTLNLRELGDYHAGLDVLTPHMGVHRISHSLHSKPQIEDADLALCLDPGSSPSILGDFHAQGLIQGGLLLIAFRNGHQDGGERERGLSEIAASLRDFYQTTFDLLWIGYSGAFTLPEDGYRDSLVALLRRR